MKILVRSVSPLLVLLGIAMLSGCSQTVHKPQLASPGPAPYQRAIAEQFDPFPLNDLGPEIVGGRPAGFEKPRSEVERSRQYRSASPWATPAPSTPAPMAIPVGGPRY